MGCDGEGRPAEDRRLGPLGVLEPRLAPPRSRPCLPPPPGGRTVGSCPACGPLEPSAAGAPGPANLPHPFRGSPASGERPQPGAKAARQVLRTWGMGLGGPGRKRGHAGRSSFLSTFKPPLDSQRLYLLVCPSPYHPEPLKLGTLGRERN